MDNFEHCAGIVRAQDKDRFLADLFVPEEVRRHLFALHGFNVETAHIRSAITEPLPGEMRLQWWRDVLAGGEGGGHPVAAALLETIAGYRLPLAAFEAFLAARSFDLYDDPMPAMGDLEGYLGETVSALFQMAAIVLASGEDPGSADAAGHAGVAYGLMEILRRLPYDTSRRQTYLPADLMARHGALAEDLFAGRTTPELRAVLATLRQAARDHAARAGEAAAGLPRAVRAAFLPLAVVEPYLRRMEAPGFDPLHHLAEVPQWRRQWRLWRVARRAF